MPNLAQQVETDFGDSKRFQFGMSLLYSLPSLDVDNPPPVAVLSGAGLR
jgi:hypothetical protein